VVSLSGLMLSFYGISYSQKPHSLLEVNLKKDESITAEAGALVYMRDVQIDTKTHSGILKTLKVSILGNESFFVNKYTAKHDVCVLGLTSPPVGDIINILISNIAGFRV